MFNCCFHIYTVVNNPSAQGLTRTCWQTFVVSEQRLAVGTAPLFVYFLHGSAFEKSFPPGARSD